MKQALCSALAALLLALPLTAAAQQRLLPVDEAATVPDFFSFRAQLQAALARRDAAAVKAALHKDVKLSFGGDAGLEAFDRLWRPAAPDSRLWDTMAAVLALGGAFGPEGTFTAPYVFARWPQDKDAFEHLAAIGSGVRVRAAPDASAATIGSLDFSIVERAEPAAADARWVRIKLPVGRSGFVDERYLRSPIDYRLMVSKVDGRWQVMLFLAGD